MLLVLLVSTCRLPGATLAGRTGRLPSTDDVIAPDAPIFRGLTVYTQRGHTFGTTWKRADSLFVSRVARLHGAALGRHFGVTDPAFPVPMGFVILATPLQYTTFLAEHFPEAPHTLGYYITRQHWGLSYPYATSFIHELTHAFLHRHVERVPRWFDEGLAEFFGTSSAWHEASGIRQLVAKRHPAKPFGNLTAGDFRSIHVEWLAAIPAANRRPSAWLLRKTTDRFDPRWWAMAWATLHFLDHTRSAGRSELQRLFSMIRKGSLEEKRYLEGPTFDRFPGFVERLIRNGRATGRLQGAGSTGP